jgi:hypothetical protein
MKGRSLPAADAALSFCASASRPIWDAQNPLDIRCVLKASSQHLR